MPVVSWFASFIFLGLSVSVGLLIYFLLYSKKKKDQEEGLPPELRGDFTERKKEEETLEDLEKTYGKKG